MKTAEEFQSYYQRILIADLQLLDEERKKFIKSLLKISLIFLAIGLACEGAVTFFESSIIEYNTMAIGVPVIVFIIWLIIFIFKTNKFSRQFADRFKKTVIAKIVKFVDENLNYYPENGIGQSSFSGSSIFQHGIDRYKSEDLVSGKLGLTKIEFSEVHAEYKTETYHKGRKQTHWHTIFKGLFFIADFNKNFSTRTVVLPDTAEKLFGFLGKTLQSMNITRDPLIKLEDPEFEKNFVVYGQDQIEARYILSTSLMKRIVDFKKKTKKEISLAFVNSSVYATVPVSKNLFEPRVFSTIVNFDLLKEYFEYMLLSAGIVDDLNLNTRIWSKG